MGNSEQLTPRQKRAIQALITSRNITEAAKAAKVSRRTLTGWLALPCFVAELKAAETTLIDTAVRRLANATGTAIDTLITAMQSADKDSVKVTAANTILSRLLDLRTLYDIDRRMTDLEARYAQTH